MRLPSTSIVFILKSMPMVVIKVGLKELFAYRKRRHVLPTPAKQMGWGAACEAKGAVTGVRCACAKNAPELPIVNNLICMS